MITDTDVAVLISKTNMHWIWLLFAIDITVLRGLICDVLVFQTEVWRCTDIRFYTKKV